MLNSSFHFLVPKMWLTVIVSGCSANLGKKLPSRRIRLVAAHWRLRRILDAVFGYERKVIIRTAMVFAENPRSSLPIRVDAMTRALVLLYSDPHATSSSSSRFRFYGSGFRGHLRVSKFFGPLSDSSYNHQDDGPLNPTVTQSPFTRTLNPNPVKRDPKP